MNVPFSSVTLWKYVFLVVNCFITAITVLLISCGVITLGGAGSLVGAYTAASVGFLAMFIAFMGTMASVRQSVFLSWAYIVTSVLFIILQTACMIAFGIYMEDLKVSAAQHVQSVWDGRPDTQVEMDDLQIKFRCCGRDSPQDYLSEKVQELPDSCCFGEVCSDEDEHLNAFPNGCVDAAGIYLSAQSCNLIWIIVGLIALQVAGVTSAYYFIRSMANLKQKREQIAIKE